LKTSIHVKRKIKNSNNIASIGKIYFTIEQKLVIVKKKVSFVCVV